MTCLIAATKFGQIRQNTLESKFWSGVYLVDQQSVT